MERALYLAINKTLRQARTASDREIRKVYNIRQSFILRYIRLINAAYSRLYGDLKLPTHPVPMGEFLTVKKNKKKGGGIFIQIKKSGGKKEIKGGFLFRSKYNTGEYNSTPKTNLSVMHRSNAENAKSYSGNKFQFRHKRVNPQGKDLPIGAIFSVSPFSSVFNATVKKQLLKTVEENLMSNSFELLDKMAAGYIKDANNRGRYRR